MRFIFFILFVLLLMPFCVAAPKLPTIISNELGFEIGYPHLGIVSFLSDVDLNFHVFNSTSSVPIISGITCYLHLYDYTGEHIYTGQTNSVEHQFDYSFIISKSNFTKIGLYPYVLQCNNSLFGGAVSDSLDVKEFSGGENVYDPISGFSVIIFLLVINIAVFFLPFIVKLKSPSTTYVLKGMLYITSIFLLWFNITLVRVMSLNNVLGIDDFLIAYWWFLTLCCIAGVFIVVYITAIGTLNLFKETQINKRMGENE